MDINGVRKRLSYKQLILVPQICGNLRVNPNQIVPYKLQKTLRLLSCFFIMT